MGRIGDWTDELVLQPAKDGQSGHDAVALEHHQHSDDRCGQVDGETEAHLLHPQLACQRRTKVADCTCESLRDSNSNLPVEIRQCDDYWSRLVFAHTLGITRS